MISLQPNCSLKFLYYHNRQLLYFRTKFQSPWKLECCSANASSIYILDFTHLSMDCIWQVGLHFTSPESSCCHPKHGNLQMHFTLLQMESVGPCWMIESLLCVVRNFISCCFQDCTSVPVHTSQAWMQNWATGFAHSTHLGSSQISMLSYPMVHREGSALGVSSQLQITECLVTTIYRSRDWNKTRPWKHAESVLTEV